MTLQLVHMLHSLYYPITTALHKDAMQCNDIALGILGFTRGRGARDPLSTLRAHRSPTAYTPPGDTFCRNVVHWIYVCLLGSQCTL